MANIETLCMSCMTDIDGQAICPDCGVQDHKQRNAVALPLKTVLNKRFLVGRVLGKPGGFGITYLVWDMLLETTAAIKEFLPLSSVSREPENVSVRANSKHDQVCFNQGLQIFLKEAKTLAQFSHPNIVRVRDCFTSNNTAYLVMEYHKGLPLDQIISAAGGRLSEQRALEIILPILDGLDAIHKKRFLHRDIKPQNIYVTDKGVPLLLDFGASRFALADTTNTLTVMLSAGYAPFEQYHKKGKQGPWSDIYSIGATLYFMVTGKMPTDAIERQHENNVLSPIIHNPQLSESFSLAVMKALSVSPQSRPQSIAALKQLLLGNSYQSSTMMQTRVSNPDSQSPPIFPATKAPRQPVIIQYDTKKSSLSLSRILIYLGLAAVLWSNWSTRQTSEDNNIPSQVEMTLATDAEHLYTPAENLADEYVDTDEPFKIEAAIEAPRSPVEITPFSTPPKQSERPALMPNPAPPTQMVISKVASTVCDHKSLHSPCKIDSPTGIKWGRCLPEKQGKMACFTEPPPHPPPPPHFRPQFRR